MTVKISEKKEGAQIYRSKVANSMMKKMGEKEDVTKVWRYREYQTHMSVPNIDYAEESSFDIDVSEMVFWVSFLERYFLDNAYIGIFVSESGESKKSRFSNYSIRTKDAVERIAIRSKREFSRSQKDGLKASFERFVSNAKRSGRVRVLDERLDNKGLIDYIEFELCSDSYCLVNTHLYDSVFIKNTGNLTTLRNTISVFVYIMSKTRKNIGGSVFSANAEKNLRQLTPNKMKDSRSFSNGLSYKYISSGVCYSHLKSISKDLSLGRSTVSLIVKSLSEMQVISYILLKDREYLKERYFITDSYSEPYLVSHVMTEFKSSREYSVIKISSVHGVCE